MAREPRHLYLPILVGIALWAGACSDNPPAKVDQAVVKEASVDAPGRDAGVDLARDAARDTAADASPADAGRDASGDLQADGSTGPAAPWPEWVFHHWVWEDESTQQSATQHVADYLAHNIPVGAIIIDSPWETGYNTLEWDKTLFPDPKQMIDDFHAKKVRVVTWIVPGINTDVQPLYDDAKANNYFMQQLPFAGPGTVNWWKGKGSLIDYFNPAALSWWHGLVDKTLAYGIDGWKCDGLDFAVWETPWSNGKNFFISRTDYSHAYYRDFFDYTRQKLGNDRVITARPVDTYGYDVGTGLVKEAAFAPVDISWAAWVGDQDATFDGLKAALLNMYYSAYLGYVIFGSDIGGYREDNNFPTTGRSKELFIRWAQLGAFCPFMENGGGGEHRPWMFDVQTTDIYRTFVKLHYQLIPYLMSEGAKAFAAKKSLVTFVDKFDYFYTLGPDIFVAPMIASGTSRKVTFPAGSSWVYLFDKTHIYPGGSTANLTVPLDEFPVFLRQGSSLATTLAP